jgi:beta-galactosidase
MLDETQLGPPMPLSTGRERRLAHGVDAQARRIRPGTPVRGPASVSEQPLPGEPRGAAEPGPERQLPGRWPARLRPMVFGGDYNPEQWPPDVQLEDVALMRQAGVNAVTLGVFAWALLEPEPGRYDFGWLDAVLDRLHDAGVSAVLATPTASPPAWFSTAHPDTLPVTREGVRLGIGARESFCPSSARYRQAAVGIARRLGEHYRAHPALALWHVGNEHGAHIDGCYCAASEEAFRVWLQRRYGDIATLNEAWGTTFWGQRYTGWEQVGVPRRAPMPVNPGQQLDFRRFTDAQFRDCYRAERDVLRELTPAIPVTTNFMSSSCPHLDYWSWAGEVDVVANNHYLTAEDPQNHLDLAMSADLTRSLAGGRPWMLMEHSTSAVNWQPRNLAKRPGEMSRNSLTHVARGSDSVMFFQWRASRVGAEKFHSAMLPQAGTDSRVWREVTELGGKLAALREVAGATVTTQVGIVWDWNAMWALELEYRPSVDITYRGAVDAAYGALWRRGLTVEFVRPGEVPKHLRLLLVPSLYLCSAGTAAALRRYVEGGGQLLVWCFSGIVDDTDVVHPGAYPGALRDLLGLWIEEFHPLAAGGRVQVGPGHEASLWSESVVTSTASTVWTFGTGPDTAGPALTRNDVGLGSAWYLATRPERAGLDAVLDLLVPAAGLPAAAVAQGLEVVRRVGPDARYLFVINHADVDASLPAHGVDLLTGSRHDGALTVAAGGVAVLREDPEPSSTPSHSNEGGPR